MGEENYKNGDTAIDLPEVSAEATAQAEAIIARAMAPAAPGVAGLDDMVLAEIGNSIVGENQIWQRYVKQADGEGSWLAQSSASVASYIERNRPMFATAMLTTYTEDNSADACYITDSVYFDIDRPEIEDAITQTGKLVSKLVGHGVPVGAIRAYASGGKGFHLEVPLTTFIEGGAASLALGDLKALPAIFRALAESLYVDGLDLSVYSSKRGRMWRRPGVQRSNGAHKVPVPAADIECMTPESYAELVSEPCAAVPVAHAPFCPSLGLLWATARNKALDVKRQQASRRAMPRAGMAPEHTDRLISALNAIDPGIEYNEWSRIGMALHEAMGDAGLAVWENWSRTSGKYKEGDCTSRWNGFVAGLNGGATDATIYMLAKQAGWRDPAPWLASTRDVTVNPDARPRFSDAGMAEFVAAKFGDRLKFVEDIGRWAAWDGRRWTFTKDPAHVSALVKEIRRDLQRAVAAEQDDDKRKGLLKFVLYLEGAKAVRNVADLLKLESSIRVGVSMFDAHPYLLNLENGVLDLKRGVLLPHAPELLLSQMAHVAHDPAATCPRFTQFMREITCDDADLAKYLQTVLGYSLSADISAHAFWVLPGKGGNGKSVLMNAIHGLMGDYAQTLNVSAVMVRRNGGPEPELVKLRGARFVRVSEPSAGHQFNESALKDLASGDVLQVRDMYAGAFELRPVAKLFVATNWKPTIAGTDDGIWQRVNVVPFNATFRRQGTEDTHLPEKLAQERAGMLNWLLQGFQQFQAGGLRERPRAVIEATEGYREELDIVGHFVRECLAMDDAAVAGTREAGRVPAAAMYAAYRDYCNRGGLATLNQNRFGAELGKHVEKTRDMRGWGYTGCRLWEDSLPERERERLDTRVLAKALEGRPDFID